MSRSCSGISVKANSETTTQHKSTPTHEPGFEDERGALAQDAVAVPTSIPSPSYLNEYCFYQHLYQRLRSARVDQNSQAY